MNYLSLCLRYMLFDGIMPISLFGCKVINTYLCIGNLKWDVALYG